jgi:hypothetical protein
MKGTSMMQIVERLTPPALPPALKLAPEPASPEPSAPEPEPRPRAEGACPKCGRAYTGKLRRCYVCVPWTGRGRRCIVQKLVPAAPVPPPPEPEPPCEGPVVGPWLAREFEAARKVAEAVEGLDREAINRVFLHVLAAVAPAESAKTAR